MISLIRTTVLFAALHLILVTGALAITTPDTATIIIQPGITTPTELPANQKHYYRWLCPADGYYLATVQRESGSSSYLHIWDNLSTSTPDLTSSVTSRTTGHSWFAKKHQFYLIEVYLSSTTSAGEYTLSLSPQSDRPIYDSPNYPLPIGNTLGIVHQEQYRGYGYFKTEDFGPEHSFWLTWTPPRTGIFQFHAQPEVQLFTPLNRAPIPLHDPAIPSRYFLTEGSSVLIGTSEHQVQIEFLPIPEILNDHPSLAIPVTELSELNELYVDTTYARPSPENLGIRRGAPSSLGYFEADPLADPHPALWYRITLQEEAVFKCSILNTRSNFLYLYSSENNTPQQLIATAAGSLPIRLLANETYFLAVAPFSLPITQSGTLYATPITETHHDTPSDALVISEIGTPHLTAPYSINPTATVGSADLIVPSSKSFSQSRWIRWTSPSSGFYMLVGAPELTLFDASTPDWQNSPVTDLEPHKTESVLFFAPAGKEFLAHIGFSSGTSGPSISIFPSQTLGTGTLYSPIVLDQPSRSGIPQQQTTLISTAALLNFDVAKLLDEHLWFEWQAPSNGNFQFLLTRSQYSSGGIFEAYREEYGEFVPVPPENINNYLTLTAVAGETYYFYASNSYSTDEVLVTLSWTETTTPPNDLSTSPLTINTGNEVVGNLSQAATAPYDENFSLELPAPSNSSSLYPGSSAHTLHYRWTPSQTGAHSLICDNGSNNFLIYPENQPDKRFRTFQQVAKFWATQGQVYRIISYHSGPINPDNGEFSFTINKVSHSSGHFVQAPISLSGVGSRTIVSNPSIFQADLPEDFNPGSSATAATWVRWTAPYSGIFTVTDNSVRLYRGSSSNSLEWIYGYTFRANSGEHIYIPRGSGGGETSTITFSQGSVLPYSNFDYASAINLGSPPTQITLTQSYSSVNFHAPRLWYKFSLSNTQTLEFARFSNNYLVELYSVEGNTFTPAIPGIQYHGYSTGKLKITLPSGNYALTLDPTHSGLFPMTAMEINPIVGNSIGSHFTAPLPLSTNQTSSTSGSFPLSTDEPPLANYGAIGSLWASFTAPQAGVYQIPDLDIFLTPDSPSSSNLTSKGIISLQANQSVLLRKTITQEATNYILPAIGNISLPNHGDISQAITVPPQLDTPYHTTILNTTPSLLTHQLVPNLRNKAGWYHWTAPVTGTFQLNTTGGQEIEFFLGTNSQNLQHLFSSSSSATSSARIFQARAGDQFSFLAHTPGYNYDPGQISFTFSMTGFFEGLMLNDDFVNAIPLTQLDLGQQQTVIGNDGSVESSEPLMDLSHTRSAWWSLTLDTPRTIEANYLLSSFNIYTGSELESLTLVEPISVYIDPYSTIYPDRKTYQLEANTTYYLQLANNRLWSYDDFSITLHERAENDEIETATPLIPETLYSVDFTTATPTPNYTNSGRYETTDVWLTYQASTSTAIRFTWDISSRLSIACFLGHPDDNNFLRNLGNSTQPIYLFEAGRTYYIQLEELGNIDPPNRTLTTEVISLTSNDERSSPTVIPSSQNITRTISTGPSTVTYDENLADGTYSTTWASFTAPTSGNYRFLLEENSNTRLQLYTTLPNGKPWKSGMVGDSQLHYLDSGQTVEISFGRSGNNTTATTQTEITISRETNLGDNVTNPLDLGYARRYRFQANLSGSSVQQDELNGNAIEDSSWGSLWWTLNTDNWSSFISIEHSGPGALQQTLTALNIGYTDLTTTAVAINTGYHDDRLTATARTYSDNGSLIRYSAPKSFNEPFIVTIEPRDSTLLHEELSSYFLDLSENGSSPQLESLRDEENPPTTHRARIAILLTLSKLSDDPVFGPFLSDFLSLSNIEKRLPFADFLKSSPNSSVLSQNPAEITVLIDSFRPDLEHILNLIPQAGIETDEVDYFATSETAVAITLDPVDVIATGYLAAAILATADFFSGLETNLTANDLLQPDWNPASLLVWHLENAPQLSWPDPVTDRRGFIPGHFSSLLSLSETVISNLENGKIPRSADDHLSLFDLHSFQEFISFLEAYETNNHGALALLSYAGTPLLTPSPSLTNGQLPSFTISDSTLNGLIDDLSLGQWHALLRTHDLLADPANYSEWANRQKTIYPTFNTLPELDFDNDGRTNWHEYAFPSNPAQVDQDESLKIQTSIGPLYLALKTRIEPTDIEYLLEKFNGDHWAPALGSLSQFVTPSSNGAQSQHFTPTRQDSGLYRLRAIPKNSDGL